MKISDPLRVPFKTALDSVNSAKDAIPEIHTGCGAIIGGATFNQKLITVAEDPGLGILGIQPGRICYID